MTIRNPYSAFGAIGLRLHTRPTRLVQNRSFERHGTLTIPLVLGQRNASSQTASSSKSPPKPSSKAPIVRPNSIPNQVAHVKRPISASLSRSVNPSVNPPASTRPVPLVLPSRKPDQSTLSFYFAYGRTYLSFYKTGLKNIYANFRTMLEIKRRIGANPHGQGINRAEFQLLRRNRHDAARVPVFALMLCIFGEFLPVIMTVFKSRITPLIPYTCRLPSQIEAQRMKQLKGRENALKRLNGLEPDDLDDTAYLRYSAEYFGIGKPLLPIQWQPTFLLSRSVEEHMAYIRKDNAGLTRYGGVAGLEDEEVVLAAVERGLWDPDTPVQELRKRVEKVLVDAAKFEAKIAKVTEKVGAKELDQLERMEKSAKRK